MTEREEDQFMNRGRPPAWYEPPAPPEPQRVVCSRYGDTGSPWELADDGGGGCALQGPGCGFQRNGRLLDRVGDR